MEIVGHNREPFSDGWLPVVPDNGTLLAYRANGRLSRHLHTGQQIAAPFSVVRDQQLQVAVMEYLSGQFKEEPDADLGSWLLAIQSAAHNCQMPLSRALLHTLAALFAMRIGHGGSVATKRGAFLRRLHLFLNGSTLPPGYLVTTTSTPDTPDLCKVGSLNTVCHKKYLRWATTYLQRLQDPDPKQLMADWMVTTALLCRKNTIAGIMASLKAPTSPGSTTLDQKQILKALLRVGPIYLKLARRHDASYAAALSALLIQAQHRNADVPTAPTFGL